MKKYRVWYKEIQERIMSCYVEADNPIEADRFAHEKGFGEEEMILREESQTHVENDISRIAFT